MTASSIDDLMALALVRRLLLDMGRELQPDALSAEAMKVGALELWIHTGHSALDGKSPVQFLKEPDGEQRVRAVLAGLVQQSDAARAARATQDEQAGDGEDATGG